MPGDLVVLPRDIDGAAGAHLAAERGAGDLGEDRRVAKPHGAGDVVHAQVDGVHLAALQLEVAFDAAAVDAQRAARRTAHRTVPPPARQGGVGAADVERDDAAQEVVATREVGATVGGGDVPFEAHGARFLRHTHALDAQVGQLERHLHHVHVDVAQVDGAGTDAHGARRHARRSRLGQQRREVERAGRAVEAHVDRQLAAEQRGQEVAHLEVLEGDVDAATAQRDPLQRHGAPGVAGAGLVHEVVAVGREQRLGTPQQRLPYGPEPRCQREQAQGERHGRDGEEGSSAHL